MKLNISRTAWITTGMLALLLAGCGGGGSSTPGATPAIGSPSTASGGSPVVTPGVLSVTLAPSANTLTLGLPLVVTATVRDKAGQPAANALLAFAVDPLLATMTPAAGQVATDSSGKASVTLTPASVNASGATLVTVLAQYGGESAKSDAALTVAAPKLSFNQVTPQASLAQVAAYGTTLITLDVLNDGVVLAGLPVTLDLASACAAAGRATLPASVTTVQGRAQVTYQDKGCAQADSIAATVAGGTARTTVALAVAVPDATSIVVGDIVPADASIVIQGAGGNGRTETAQVRFRVLDKTGAPVANQSVAFATISTKAVRLSQTAGVTDATGYALAILMSGTEPTAVRVVATLPNGLSTVSDTVTVTTGLPAQMAFSLSAQSFNIEGFDYDDVADVITVLLADQFSNPVADGVPVVLQTDSGAIGTSARGGCVTVNGRCTVDLRSQNPRYASDAASPKGRAGLATITASSLAASATPVTGSTAVFLSGSLVANVTLTGAVAGVAVAGKTLTIDAAGCNGINFGVRLSDARRNPLPSGSALTFDNVLLMSGSAYPAKVPSVAPMLVNGAIAGDQGSVHTLSLLPDASCEAGGPKAVTGSASLVLTTPLGNATVLPILLRFHTKADTP